MQTDILVKNFAVYRKGLDKILGSEVADNVIEALGGEDAVMTATYANLADSGSAFDGSFVKNVIRLARIANSINELLPEAMRADATSLGKVCLLNQIAKVVMFSTNDNSWEVTNRGMIYKYNDLEGALRTGERSTLIAMNAGVKFTPEEFEAMGILDKNVEDDNYKKYFASPLSTVVRQAAELVTLINKKAITNKNNG